MKSLRLASLTLFLFSCFVPAVAGVATVAVASNFAPTLKALATLAEKEGAHQYRIVNGATGALYAQIRNGAPFDLLLAADSATPERLEKDGLSVPGSRFTYATGQLVLWSTQPQLIDAQGAVLKSTRYQTLALANPKTAPYGAAAQAVLQQLGVQAAGTQRWVQGESVGQTLSMVATGHAELGFVALSQLVQAGQLARGSLWRVPAALHPPIRQDAILLRRGQDNAAAQALMSALQSPAGKALIQSHGYQP